MIYAVKGLQRSVACVKILVVEDNRELNRTVCAYLTQSGYETTGCLSAQEAYDAMYGAMYDLIVSDVMVPGVDGFEFAVTVREFNLLYKLLSYPKKTFTRSQLMDEFWSLESSSSLRTVDVYITKLRDKFSGCGDFEIVTVHGLGYKAVLK